MVFFDDESMKSPLMIPVIKDASCYYYEVIPVKVGGKLLKLPEYPTRKSNLGWVTQEMINEDTRMFIEMVQ